MITFDIDANGILNVTAKDKDTGKDQKSQYLVLEYGRTRVRGLKEAEKDCRPGHREKESVKTRNELDSLVYQCEKQLTDLGDKAPMISRRSTIY